MKFKKPRWETASAAYKFLLFMGLVTLIASCEWGDPIESLVEPDPDDFAVLFSDTATVQLSTVITDSVMTGSSGRLLVGRYMDPYFGKIQAATFFQPTISSAITLPENAVYDSLVLSMTYKYDDAPYSYGDTTKPLNLTVHRLLSDILEKSSYYNHNTTAFDPAPLGTIKVTPRPSTDDGLRIRLADALGTQIFEKAKANQLGSNTEWINLLPGLMMKSSTADNSAVIGFDGSSARIQMHYHVPDVASVRRDSSVISSSAFYNQITSDRAGTQLTKLPATHRITTPASQTGNMTFVQGGLGLMTRIDLPTLRQLRNIDYTAMNKAVLRITPMKGSVTNQLRAPRNIYVYRVDKNNEFYLGSQGFPLPLYNLGGTAVVSGVFTDDLVTNQQYYDIDISAYVSELLTSETGDIGGLVLVTSPTNEGRTDIRNSTAYPWAGTDYYMSTDRLVIGSQQNSNPGVELQLFYTRINAQ